MSSPLPFKVALVGYGFVGKTFHAPLIAATPGLLLHTVVSSDPAKVLADHPGVKVAPDLDAALADPEIDLVVIATPDPLHAPQAHAALDAGKAVVIDKPFAVTLDEARAVADHAQRAGKLLSVFHNRRWDSDFLTLKALIADGSLGEIVQYESHFDRFRPVVRDRWREKPGAGALLDLGPHLIDQALQLFGPPLAV
jgi:predicted dehydrogenase